MNKKLLSAICFVTLVASCADNDMIGGLTVEKPAELAGYEYLNNYEPLKNNIVRKSGSQFKLGVGTDATQYVNQGLEYSIVNANFEETEPGNEMKMGSCVNDKGDMDFGTVSSYVNAATDAGLSVYGHTLAWHSQQPVKWLNSLIKDKPIPVPEGGDPCLHIITPNSSANTWDWTLTYHFDEPLVKGVVYKFKMRIKGNGEAPADFVIEGWPEASGGGGTQYWPGPRIPVTEGWADYSCDIEATLDGINTIIFAFGKFGGDLYFDDMVLTASGSDKNLFVNGNFDEKDLSRWTKPSWVNFSYDIEGQAAGPSTYMVDLIDNGNMEGDDAKNFCKKENSGSFEYIITDGVGKDGSRGVKIASKGGQATAWESQFWIVSNEVLHIGDKIHVEFDYRADGGSAGTNVDTQAHFGPGEYQHWSCCGTVSFKNDWGHYTKDFVVDASMAKADDKGMKSIAFNMSPNASDGNYYIDNVVLQIEKEGKGIPLTPQEKKDTLTWAMDKWIKGMMEACDGKVKAWDVVNEAISGGNPDEEGVYALQHDPEGTKPNDFYWQDYLDDYDYVRTAVRLAREYGPEDIKLFINDYNLEYEWHGKDNKKLQSLIKWIERWESDGVTKIDGIGTQTHISFCADPDIQKKHEELIKNSFQLMANTGKLIRISELDMGYDDANGNKVLTVDMTEEQHKQMSDFYKWIVKTYMEIIPAAQQWGICQWCITDSPTSSAWRPGEPTGLWMVKKELNGNEVVYRKHTYGGFADGLAGKE